MTHSAWRGVGLGMALALVGCGRGLPVSAQGVAPSRLEARQASCTLAPAEIRGGLPLSQAFQVGRSGEGWAELTLAAPQASWAQPGREAAVLTLWVDGQAQQDLVVPSALPRAQTVFLGPLSAGPHQLQVTMHPHSPAPAGAVELSAGSLGVITPEDPMHRVWAHAPIVGTRDDALRSDLPLAMFYERLPEPGGWERLRYTAVISNEDLGTSTPALFARWGRGVDIDWCYEVRVGPEGQRTEPKFQGIFHFTRDFSGRLEGAHPQLRISTPNNTYADGGRGRFQLRLAPTLGLSAEQAPREAILDRLPWIYGLMAAELFREGKCRPEGPWPLAEPDRSKAIADPRRFLYVDLKLAHRGQKVAVGLQGFGAPDWVRSDRGDEGLALDRGGWVRTAIECPQRPELAQLQALAVASAGGDGRTEVLALGQVMRLNDRLEPEALALMATGGPWALGPKGAWVPLWRAPASPAPRLPVGAGTSGEGPLVRPAEALGGPGGQPRGLGLHP